LAPPDDDDDATVTMTSSAILDGCDTLLCDTPSPNPADDRMEDAVLTLSEWLVVMEKLVTDWDWEESESDTTGSAVSACFLRDPNKHRKSVECKIELMINLY